MVYLKLGSNYHLFIDQKAQIQIVELEVIAVDDSVLSSSVPLANAILAGKVVSATEAQYKAWLDSQNLPLPPPPPDPIPDVPPGTLTLDTIAQGATHKWLTSDEYTKVQQIINAFPTDANSSNT